MVEGGGIKWVGLNSIVWIYKKMLEKGALIWNTYHSFVSFFLPPNWEELEGRKIFCNIINYFSLFSLFPLVHYLSRHKMQQPHNMESSFSVSMFTKQITAPPEVISPLPLVLYDSRALVLSVTR